jgi:glucitol/sorbitol PTS system EIIB component
VTYKAVTVNAGPGGWGGPLTIHPSDDKPIIACITGGGIHPVAQRIAELTGGEAFDAFRSTVKFDRMACAVIDCGGTARVGVYPMKGVPTIDVHPTSPTGPLASFIKETIFVSGVKPDNVTEG